MLKVKTVSFLTFLVTTIIVTQPGEAAILAPNQRVQQVVDWFTGFFTNSNQVANEPMIPFITMENCSASAVGTGNGEAQYVHLEQYIGGGNLLRTAAYEFSPSDDRVNLSVFPYVDDTMALGSCNSSTPTIDLSNVESLSCDLSLIYEPNQFFGTNAPVGCPTSFPVPDSTVVSTLTVTPDTVDSFDRFLTPDGGSFGTPIAFQRVTTTPEPINNLPLVGIGSLGLLVLRTGKHPNC